METQETICRLCLKICEGFEALKRNMKDFLDKLLPKINLAAVRKPVVCINCAEMVKKCFDFKAVCLRAHGNIIPFVNNKDGVKLNQIDVPLRRNQNGTGVSESQDICGFCMSLLNNCSAISFEERDVMLKKMIGKCLPELDLSVNKMPIICTPCYGFLEMYFRFVTNCLMVEEKIKRYCGSLDISSRGQIELSQILQFTINDVTSEADGKSLGIIKVEGQLYEERENADDRETGKGAIKLEQLSDDGTENSIAQVEQETESYMDMTDLELNNEAPRNTLACKEESDGLGVIKIEETFCEENEIKEENLVEMEDQKFLPIEAIEIKTDDTDFDRFEDGVISLHPEVATRLFRSREHLMSNPEGNLSESSIKHTLTKKHISKIRMHQCDCCSYQTKYQANFKRHLLVHRNPSEITMYKCDSCSFQTKYEAGLKMHLLMHKDLSELTMYKCDFCSFQTKYQYSLKKHLLVHRNPSEVTMYKCESCSFQTKRKSYLKKHLLVHKIPSEVTMYKCDSCPFQTKDKSYLKKHLVEEKNPSEVKMYKCDSCSFKTKYEASLKKHLLMHKDPSEVTMHKCESCSFQTRYQISFKRHLLVHKNPSEIRMYKCDSCSFQTKYAVSLKTHMLVHRKPSEVTMYKCDYCCFHTKHAINLKRHLQMHKDPSEIAMYKCESCSFQTKHAVNLKRHLQRHKDPSEVAMYKCDSCSFETKRKMDLKQHFLQFHKVSSEMTTLKRVIPHI